MEAFNPAACLFSLSILSGSRPPQVSFLLEIIFVPRLIWLCDTEYVQIKLKRQNQRLMRNLSTNTIVVRRHLKTAQDLSTRLAKEHLSSGTLLTPQTVLDFN